MPSDPIKPAAKPAGPVKPSITSTLSAQGKLKTAFSYQITASGDATYFEAVGYPSGLMVNTVTGEIHGTPNVKGVSHITLKAVNQVGMGTALLTLTIA